MQNQHKLWICLWRLAQSTKHAVAILPPCNPIKWKCICGQAINILKMKKYVIRKQHINMCQKAKHSNHFARLTSTFLKLSAPSTSSAVNVILLEWRMHLIASCNFVRRNLIRSSVIFISLNNCVISYNCKKTPHCIGQMEMKTKNQKKPQFQSWHYYPHFDNRICLFNSTPMKSIPYPKWWLFWLEGQRQHRGFLHGNTQEKIFTNTIIRGHTI